MGGRQASLENVSTPRRQSMIGRQKSLLTGADEGGGARRRSMVGRQKSLLTGGDEGGRRRSMVGRQKSMLPGGDDTRRRSMVGGRQKSLLGGDDEGGTRRRSMVGGRTGLRRQPSVERRPPGSKRGMMRQQSVRRHSLASGSNRRGLARRKSRLQAPREEREPSPEPSRLGQRRKLARQKNVGDDLTLAAASRGKETRDLPEGVRSRMAMLSRKNRGLPAMQLDDFFLTRASETAAFCRRVRSAPRPQTAPGAAAAAAPPVDAGRPSSPTSAYLVECHKNDVIPEPVVGKALATNGDVVLRKMALGDAVALTFAPALALADPRARGRRPKSLYLGDTKLVWADSCSVGLRASPSFQRWRSEHERTRSRARFL